MEGMHAAGYHSILPKEHGTKMFSLPIVKYYEKDVSKPAKFDLIIIRIHVILSRPFSKWDKVDMVETAKNLLKCKDSDENYCVELCCCQGI